MRRHEEEGSRYLAESLSHESEELLVCPLLGAAVDDHVAELLGGTVTNGNDNIYSPPAPGLA